MIDQSTVNRIIEYVEAHQGSGRCVSVAEIACRLDLPAPTVLDAADYSNGRLQANYGRICPNADLFIEQVMRRGIGP